MQKDTGADISIISSRLWNSLGKPPLSKSSKRLEAYDGHILPALGTFTTAVELKNGFQTIELVVVRSDKSFGLLGLDSIPLTAASVNQVDSNTDFLPTIKGIKATIHIDADSPDTCRARPVPLALQQLVGKELDRLERLGVISKCTRGANNASPVVWVKKPNGQLRMCADYKMHVNRRIATDSYPMPRVESIFAGMKNAKNSLISNLPTGK